MRKRKNNNFYYLCVLVTKLTITSTQALHKYFYFIVTYYCKS